MGIHRNPFSLDDFNELNAARCAERRPFLNVLSGRHSGGLTIVVIHR